VKSVKVLVVAGLLAGGVVVLPVSAAAAATQPTVPSAGSIGALLATLPDPGASTVDQFGVNVAVSGSVAVVGAYGTKSAGNSAVGTTYIYTKGSTGWHKRPKAILQDPNGATGDLFGISVAVSGTTVVVGASGANTSSGAVYIYTEGTSGWPTTPTVTLPDPAGGSFGKSVAISNNTIIVGANNSNGGDGAAGGFEPSSQHGD
jgi:FG-GAP repeat